MYQAKELEARHYFILSFVQMRLTGKKESFGRYLYTTNLIGTSMSYFILKSVMQNISLCFSFIH